MADARTRPRPGWLIDEVASAGRENLDTVHAGRYDAKEDAGAVEELALLRRLGLGADSLLVDLGAGTGQLALAAAGTGARVIAVDVSPPMLDVLRAKVAQAGSADVEVVRAGFLTYEHGEHPADFVYSRYALHHLPDFWKAVALARIRRVVRRGGVLRLSDVVYSFDAADAEERIEAWCATADVDADLDTDWSRAELEEHVRDEHSTFTWLLEPMIERAGFEIDDAELSDDGIFAAYVARAV